MASELSGYLALDGDEDVTCEVGYRVVQNRARQGET